MRVRLLGGTLQKHRRRTIIRIQLGNARPLGRDGPGQPLRAQRKAPSPVDDGAWGAWMRADLRAREELPRRYQPDLNAAIGDIAALAGIGLDGVMLAEAHHGNARRPDTGVGEDLLDLNAPVE